MITSNVFPIEGSSNRARMTTAPCKKIAIPPAKGYLYISAELLENRKDCLTIEAFREKFLGMLSENEHNVEIEKGYFPVLMCKNGARLRKLDLKVAARDYDLYVRTSRVPFRLTPTTNK